MKKQWWLVGSVLGVAVAAAVILVNRPKATDTFRVGCITPLSGEGATYGESTRRGLELASEELNAGGGVNGKRLEIIYEDDQMRSTTATTALQKLVTVDGVSVVIGAFGSSVTLAIAPIAEKNRVVLFSASSTADSIKDAGDYIFRNVPTNSAQGKTAAEFALRHLKSQTASILQMNNDYGISLSASFKSHFEAGGGRVLGTESYNPSSADFRAQLTKVRSQGPDMIFFPGHYQECALILKQAKELGVTGPFVGGDGAYSPELISVAGPAAEGSYYTLMAMGYGVADEEVTRFTSAYRAKYGGEPDVYSAYAYDALMVVADAARRGGFAADGIKDALYKTRGFRGVTGITSFDANGEVDKPFGVYEVKSGKFVPLRWKQ
jgi:branched-chain amino acid transport system substrate-binding protein